MLEVRWHGRGGQGAVTAAEILAHAAIKEGKYAQAFPAFGAERRGAPVVAFNRFDECEIRIRSEVYEPDVVAVLDSTLLHSVNVTEGLKPRGILIVNIAKHPVEVKRNHQFKVKTFTVNASKIALEVLGVPIVNTAMIGAFIKATNLLKLDSVNDTVKERFGRVGGKNIDAIIRAYNETISEK